MEYCQLGRSGVQVSRVCLGTMNFGPKASERDSHQIMDRALELGVNFFDTADAYGKRVGEGITERILGSWFAQGGARRERVVLATKVFGVMGDWPNERGLSARHIRLACDASLRRMGTDWIDLYQMHHIDRSTGWDEIWEALAVLRQQGKILYVGSSNFAGWHLATAALTAEERGLLGLVSEQSIYNLFRRDIELEVIPAAQEYGIGILPWSPLLGGVLGGMPRDGAPGDRRTEGRSADALTNRRSQLDAYEGLCEQLGHHPAQVALAWLLAQPAVTAPIVGPRTLAQLESAVGAVELSLDEKALRRLDEIFPGRRTAPEDYAW